MSSNQPSAPPELEVARIFRLVHEGRGYEEIEALARRAVDNGWTQANERVIQDSFRMRLTQLLNRRVNHEDTREFIDAVAACVTEVRDTNEALAERLSGFQLVAEQALLRPGEVPSQQFLSDPGVGRLLKHLSIAPREERTYQTIAEKFSPDGRADVLLWPLLNLNYIKCVEGEPSTYELGDDLRSFFSLSNEDPLAFAAAATMDPFDLKVPLQPIFDFMTLAYAKHLKIDDDYRIDIKLQWGVRHNRNWFQIDDFYFEDKEIRSKNEYRAAILPRVAMVEGARANSIDVLPTNAYIGFHWLISRREVPQSARQRLTIFKSDGKLAAALKKPEELPALLAGRKLVVLVDAPMRPHADLVLKEVLKLPVEAYDLVDREDNQTRLADIIDALPGIVAVTIATGPMLAMADPEHHAVLFDFANIAKAFKDGGGAYHRFAETVFHCSVNLNMRREEWTVQPLGRDRAYRVHLMMAEVIRDIVAEPQRFADFIVDVWAQQGASGPDPEAYRKLTREVTLNAIKQSYAWVPDAAVLRHDVATDWPDLRSCLFWTNPEDLFFPTVMDDLERDRSMARSDLIACVRAMESAGVRQASIDQFATRMRNAIERGAPNFASATIRQALGNLGDSGALGNPAR